MAPLRKTKDLVKKIPAAKPHLDLLAAVLTIPVLITVIILNFSNLSKTTKPGTVTPTPEIQTKTQTVIEKVPVAVTNTPTSSTTCTPGIGSLSIDLPKEGDTTSTNPVCVTISYQSNNHCGVVWAYRINGGEWSDYSNNAVCLYNMPSGQVTFDLQAKSLVNTDTVTLERHFTYSPTVTSVPTSEATPTASPTPQK